MCERHECERFGGYFRRETKKDKNGFVRGTPLLVPMDKETLPVDVEAVKKAEEENKLIMENRLKFEARRELTATGLNTKTTRSTNSKEKHTKAAAKKAAKAPTNANAGSILTDGLGRSRSPNFPSTDVAKELEPDATNPLKEVFHLIEVSVPLPP